MTRYARARWPHSCLPSRRPRALSVRRATRRGVVAGRVVDAGTSEPQGRRGHPDRRHDARRDRRQRRAASSSPAVPAGSTTLRARLLGYKTAERTVVVRAGDTTRVDFALETEAAVLGRGPHRGATRRAGCVRLAAERRHGEHHRARGGGCAEVRRAGHYSHCATITRRRGAQRFLDRVERARRRVGSESHPARRLSDLQPVSPRRAVQHVHRSDGARRHADDGRLSGALRRPAVERARRPFRRGGAERRSRHGRAVGAGVDGSAGRQRSRTARRRG